MAGLFSSFRGDIIAASRRASDAMDDLKALRSERKHLEGLSDTERVFEVLGHNVNQWVDRPYKRLPVMWHSRISDLRKKGHNIECRCVAVEKGRDYQYRLVVSEDGK